jgi:hypothetical protein
MPRATTARPLTQIDPEASHKPRNPVGVDRMRAAAARCIASQQRLHHKLEALMEEMDDVTPAHGIVTTNLSDEDSMVIAVDELRAAHKR